MMIPKKAIKSIVLIPDEIREATPGTFGPKHHRFEVSGSVEIEIDPKFWDELAKMAELTAHTELAKRSKAEADRALAEENKRLRDELRAALDEVMRLTADRHAANKREALFLSWRERRAADSEELQRRLGEKAAAVDRLEAIGAALRGAAADLVASVMASPFPLSDRVKAEAEKVAEILERLKLGK